MARENTMAIGCLALAVMSGCLFLIATMSGYDRTLGNWLYTLALVVGVGGAVVMAVVWAVWVALEVRRTEAAKQVLVARAEQLRRRRAQQRQSTTEHLEETLRRQEQERPAPPRVISLDDGPLEVVLVDPEEITITRASTRLGVCPVCQTPIVEGEEFLACPECNASHHTDCWEYISGCAVYGCKARVAG